MAYTPTHGKNTIVKVGSTDISAGMENSEFSGTADFAKAAGYGATNQIKLAGLIDGQFTCSGSYDTQATSGTAAILEGKEGTTISFTRQVAGAGSGKPQEVFSAIVTSFKVSSAFDGVVKYNGTFEVTGTVNRAAQP